MHVVRHPSLLLLAAIAILAGCQNSRSNRISRSGALFASLNSFDQKTIRSGLINAGYTPEMVQMALGEPNVIASTDASEGQVTYWMYRRFVYGHEIGVSEHLAFPLKPDTRFASLGSMPPNGGPKGGSGGGDGVSPASLHVKFVNDRVVEAIVTNRQ